MFLVGLSIAEFGRTDQTILQKRPRDTQEAAAGLQEAGWLRAPTSLTGNVNTEVHKFGRPSINSINTMEAGIFNTSEIIRWVARIRARVLMGWAPKGCWSFVPLLPPSKGS